MRSARLFAVIWVVLQSSRASAAATPAPLSSQQIFSKWHNAVVTIETPTASGTGFFDEHGFVWTAYHVVDGSKSATITFADGQQGKIFGVLCEDKVRDFAVLVPDIEVTGPKLGDYAALKPGERITVIGSPQGLAQTVTEGLVSAKRNDGSRRLLQISAGVSPGSSGSPVFNGRGEVVGLVTNIREDGQLLNFAVSSADLKGIPPGVPLSVACAPTPSGAGSPGLVLCRADADPRAEELGKSHANGYVGLKAVTLTLGEIPQPFAGAMTTDDVRHWAAEALTKAGVQILSEEEHDRRLNSEPKATSDLDYLSWCDGCGSTVYLGFQADQAADGGIDYQYLLDVDRPAVIMPGWVTILTVDSFSGNGHVAPHEDIKESVARTLKNDLATLVSRLQLANPPGK